ncbi:MAG TPA: aminoglycoside phosphotransferase family protein [Bacteroidales bacterium]|nr:aminoglycoside phosphotransferase family protein [Bacteroidales bacterium]
MADDLRNIFSQFETGQAFVSAEPFGEGHIHQTFRVKTAGDNPDFILQKINNFVFRDTDILMENLGRITSHLARKIPGTGTDWHILSFFPVRGGRLYYTDGNGAHWRLMNFIPHDTGEQMRCNIHLSAGEAYARFISLLGDLPGPPLKETIPDFHNLDKRLRYFREASGNAISERKKRAAGDILFAEERAVQMAYIPDVLAEGKIRLRPTHNDTKLDNILFSSSGVIRGVVDLDTVMPGLPHYDYGDAIRSFGNSCLEDEKALERIELRMDVFESFSAGFISTISGELNDMEKQTLVYAPPMFAYMQGIRFLTDYLSGDPYYKTAWPEHNLVRARNQFALLASMDNNFTRMREIIEKLLA